MAQTSSPASGRPVLALGSIFLRIGAGAFGGLGASLALIERELVTKRQWLTAADVTAALTYTKLLPGSTGPQVVAYLGYTLGGWVGSAVATAAFLCPAALLMLVLAAAYVSVTAVPVMQPALYGLTAATVGILLATTYRMGKAHIPDRLTLRMALASMVAGAVLGISAAVIVVLAGLVGVGLYVLPLCEKEQPAGHARMGRIPMQLSASLVFHGHLLQAGGLHEGVAPRRHGGLESQLEWNGIAPRRERGTSRHRRQVAAAQDRVQSPVCKNAV